jgi:hypothetical protein
MKHVLAISILLLLSAPGHAQSGAKIDRQAFYQAMEQDKTELVNKQLKQVSAAPAELRQAFEGTLIMKKAGLGGGPGRKLKLFKAGHKELEAAIKREPHNVEYRFLRLMIQENAPGILGYNDNLEADSEIIKKSYKTLPQEVQQAIEDYSKKSKVLKLQVS